MKKSKDTSRKKRKRRIATDVSLTLHQLEELRQQQHRQPFVL
ncbi:hypothetical protein [Microvirga sp. VF16]|nr:hypothetical protein [Microvirga sp. VF16]